MLIELNCIFFNQPFSYSTTQQIYSLLFGICSLDIGACRCQNQGKLASPNLSRPSGIGEK
jgi:hypothetical protein